MEHTSRSKYSQYRSKLHSAIRKYGSDNFCIEHIASTKNLVSLRQLEVDLIVQENTTKNGYNLTFGGEHTVFTEEVKAKISNTKMGHLVSKETREKLSNIFAQSWLIIYPNGNQEEIINLTKFCKHNNLDMACMAKVARNTQNRKQHKGFKCIALGGHNS